MSVQVKVHNADGSIVQNFIDEKGWTHEEFLLNVTTLTKVTKSYLNGFRGWKNNGKPIPKALQQAGLGEAINKILAEAARVAGGTSPRTTADQARQGLSPADLRNVNVDDLCIRLGDMDLKGRYYTYLWIDVSAAAPWRGLTLKTFAKCVIYVGKGTGDRYLHKDATVDGLRDFAETKFKNRLGRRFYAIKIPFVDLNENEALLIEGKLIECLVTVHKKHRLDYAASHLCVSHWTCACLFNDRPGQKVRGSVRPYFASRTGQDLLQDALDYFDLNVFSKLR